MKTNHALSGLFAKLALSAALAFSVSTASAGLILNFESVDASGGPVDATSYLASYGITLSGVSHPGSIKIWSDQMETFVAATSGHNFLNQNVSGSPVISYTLNFSTALTDLSFSRIQSVLPNLVAQWSATAYAGVTVVGTVGENMTGGTAPAQTFSIADSNYLTDGGITSLRIDANGFGVAGISSAPIDNLTINPVPEPGTALFGLACVGVAALRRRRSAAVAVKPKA